MNPIPEETLAPEQSTGARPQVQAGEPDVKPSPRDSRALPLWGIFLILVFYTLHFASEIVLPIVLALVLYLLLRPSMRMLSKWHIPKAASALIILTMLCGAVVALGFTLSGPVSEWIGKAPAALPRLEQRLTFLTAPLAKVLRTSEQIDKIGDDPATALRSVTVKGPSLGSFLASGTRSILTGFLTFVVLLFFLLVSGDVFLRRFLESRTTLRNKVRALDISNEIESHISGYLVTISLMNTAVGIATGFAAYFCGLSDPILWGTVAFLLNYVLILGPLACAVVLFFAGFLTFDTTLHAVLPAAIYLAIHFAEGECITPMLLARRFTLNPVLIIVSLLFWYWMWGVAGALLAVPLLGAFKIICDRVQPLRAMGHILGSDTRA